MIWVIGIFLLLAFITWRQTRSNYNRLAHWLNIGSNNAEVTQESALGQLLVKANRYFMERKWPAAEKAYLKVLKLDHKNMTAFRRLGLVYSYMRNFEDAAECCEYVIKHDPTATDLQNYATVFYHLERFDEAITTMQRALELEPTLTRYVGLARMYAALNRDEKQLEALLAAHEVSRDDQMAISLIVQWYQKHGEHEQAGAWKRRIESVR